MKLKLLLVFSVFTLAACGGSGGGGSSSDVDKMPVVDEQPDTTVGEEPMTEEPTVPVTEEPDNSGNETCTDLSALAYTVSDDNTNDGHLPANVIDENTTDDSRWSSDGNNKYLQFDFQQSVNLSTIAILWYKGDERQSYFEIETSDDGTNWQAVLTSGQSTIQAKSFETYNLLASQARYLRLVGQGNSVNSWNSVIEVVVNHCDEHQSILPAIATPDNTPDLPPVDANHTIELNDWYLSIPTDTDNNGRADSISEQSLVGGYQNANYFYPSSDGGLVFKVPVDGYKTSTNTSYTRSELREMLRRGNTSHKTQGINKNNWVFSSASASEQSAAGGVDGTLTAELAVNYVTTTGNANQLGRVIIGQIHANDDEPIRLYYRKLPNNTNGAIYFAHEVLGGDDLYFEMIGSRSQSASNPSDGIALNERFGYEIKVVGNLLSVKIMREGKPDVTESYDMSASNYHTGGQYMYFKAGVYNQNNTGDANDYVQATFYKIENKHTGYEH